MRHASLAGWLNRSVGEDYTQNCVPEIVSVSFSLRHTTGAISLLSIRTKSYFMRQPEELARQPQSPKAHEVHLDSFFVRGADLQAG